MATKKKSVVSTEAEVKNLAAQGYTLLPVSRVFSDKQMGSGWDDVLNAEMMRGVTLAADGKAVRGAAFVPTSQERMEGVSRIGTRGLGWMEWGANNALPNRVAALAHLLPYTAVGLRFNVETCAGLGPQPMYHYVSVSNGNVEERDIPYADAGALLLQRVRESGGVIGDDGAILAIPTGSNGLDGLKTDYERWRKTNKELQEFLDRNNVDDIAMRIISDMVYFNICFPELQLSAGSADPSKPWEPKVVGIAVHPAHATRLERMDEYGRINYVYCSNRWLERGTVDADEELIPIAIPALDPTHPASSLRDAVRDNRLRGAKTRKSRRTSYVLPLSFPTPGRPYYPATPWHSIFNGDLYAYCSTIVSDRYARKKNSNIIGRVIYVHTDYLERLYLQGADGTGCNTEEERNAMRDRLWESINTFLGNPGNAGKSLLGFTFTGTDGKEHDAFRIVDIPAATKNDAEAQKTELQEISSAILFALMVNPALIGAVPGSSGMGGGTYQRELFLLKQAQLAPTQRIVMKPFETASRFNGWDEHLVWKTKQVTLTTLDRSKTGLIETEQ